MVLLIAGIAAATHIMATLAFTGPTTPIKQSLQPQLNRYFLGPLDQGWNLFAPGPYSQDEYLLIRGCTSSPEICAGGVDAGAEFTEWHNVTAQEMEAIQGNIFANRETRQSKAIVGRLWGALADLNDDHRHEVAQPSVLGEYPFGVDVMTAEEVEGISSSELSKLRQYQRLEDVAVGFASLYALSEWDGASMVELRLLRRAVPQFAQRHDPPEERSENTMYIGWRDTIEFDRDTTEVWK